MKNLVFVFLLLTTISCQKEKEESLHDYIGTYNIKSTLIKFQYNDFGVCYTGMDSIKAHQADSINNLQPDFYLDTIYKTQTIKISVSKYSEKELVVENLLGLKETLYFYNPENSNELKFVRMNNEDYNPFRATYHRSVLRENQIIFDFEIFGDYTTFTISGLANKLE